MMKLRNTSDEKMMDTTNIIQNKKCYPAGFEIIALGSSTTVKSQSAKLHLICEKKFAKNLGIFSYSNPWF